MTEDELLSRYGLEPDVTDIHEIRTVIRDEVDRARARSQPANTGLLRLGCAQLFASGAVEDSLLIWRAKSASMDAFGAIDIQLMCGQGLEETMKYLQEEGSEEARRAHEYLTECKQGGDFDGFSRADYLQFAEEYYDDPD